MRPILDLCRTCGSEGRLYVATWGYEPGCGHAPNHFEEDRGECPDCEGTGWELIPSEPMTEDDLNEMDEELGTLTPGASSMREPV